MDKKEQACCEIEELRRQITSLRALPDTAPIGLLIVDHRSDAIQYFNNAFLHIWAIGHLKGPISSGELKYREIVSHLLHLVSDPQGLLQLYEKIRKEDDVVLPNQMIKLADDRYICLNSSLIMDQGSQLHCRVYAFEDVTRITKAEDEARKSNERYKELADLLPQIVFEMDLGGNLTFVNRSAFEVMGYTKDEFKSGLNVLAMVVPEDRDRARQNIRKVLSGEQSGQEYTFIRKDGSRFPVIVHSSVILRDKKPVGLRGIIIDITEHKQEEEKLLLTQASIDNFPDSCIWLGMDRQIVYVNDAACISLGYTREKLLTMNIRDVDPTYSEERDREVATELMKKGFYRFESLRKTRDGRLFPVDISCKYHRQGNKEHIITFERDITDRKLTEERIKNSLREKEVLLKEVHHRVKNNMQIISSLLNLQMSGIDHEPVRHILTESQSRIRSIALVHERMYMSNDLARINFSEYLKNLSNQLLLTYRTSSGKVKLAIEGENIHIGVDQAVPCGLIMNELISNSLKHAFPGSGSGTIKIQLQSADYNTITLEDDGVGIPESFSLSNPQSMGMQLVSALVEQLEGKITLDRSCGTRFTITFPAR